MKRCIPKQTAKNKAKEQKNWISLFSGNETIRRTVSFDGKKSEDIFVTFCGFIYVNDRKNDAFFSVVRLKRTRYKKEQNSSSTYSEKFEIKHLFAAPERKNEKQKEEFNKEIFAYFFFVVNRIPNWLFINMRPNTLAVATKYRKHLDTQKFIR